MMRTEFLRVTPESVGILSSAVDRLLDNLQSGFTEMHGLQIMRYGKICAEGWWSPYAPGIRHNLMSVTKTYAATSIGIACTEGQLRLTDRIIDIFPDESPKQPDVLLSRLTVRDVLRMGCGMESIPAPTVDWVRDFIATPVIHAPGTRFFYNSIGSSLLGKIIHRQTGLGLSAYLKPRLFDPIGIDADNLRWARMPDGIEAGGAGLYATTEDNLRLMKLYLDGGVWEGQRILSKAFVREATTKQIETASEAAKYPFAEDSFCGYGYQMWMCRPEGVYRADGAMGQFAVVLPDRDMIISITETGRGIDGPQKTLNALWDFLKNVSFNASLPENPAAFRRLQKRLASLSLARPAYRPHSKTIEWIQGKWFDVADGVLGLENQTLSLFCGQNVSKGMTHFRFLFNSHSCAMEFCQDGAHSADIALDGSRALNKLSIAQNTATLVYLSGSWAADDTFTVVCRWIETSFEKELHFFFHDTGCTISTSDPLHSCGPLGEIDDPPVTALIRTE